MPFDMVRKKFHSEQKRLNHAEHALPILIYYATVLKRSITYSELSGLLGTNKRNLGRPFILHGVGGIPGLKWLIVDLFNWKHITLTTSQQHSAVDTYRRTISKTTNGTTC